MGWSCRPQLGAADSLEETKLCSPCHSPGMSTHTPNQKSVASHYQHHSMLQTLGDSHLQPSRPLPPPQDGTHHQRSLPQPEGCRQTAEPEDRHI